MADHPSYPRFDRDDLREALQALDIHTADLAENVSRVAGIPMSRQTPYRWLKDREITASGAALVRTWAALAAFLLAPKGSREEEAAGHALFDIVAPLLSTEALEAAQAAARELEGDDEGGDLEAFDPPAGHA